MHEKKTYVLKKTTGEITEFWNEYHGWLRWFTVDSQSGAKIYDTTPDNLLDLLRRYTEKEMLVTPSSPNCEFVEVQ